MNIDIIKHGQKHFKMAHFCVGKLTRKNGDFQSTAVKSKKKSRVMLKCHFSPRVKVKLHCQGYVLSRGRARCAFCFLLNKVGDLSFFWHNVLV